MKKGMHTRNTKTLYKYVRDPNLFLEGFYIRATQLSALNDPFEAKFSKKGVEKGRQYYDLPIWPCLIEDKQNKVGVVCLSESKDNLLMWSHYANEHKGCVLGFTVSPQESSDISLNTFRFFECYTREKSSSFDGNFYPVSYRKQRRYSHDILESSVCDLYFDNGEVLIQEVFQVKSDEWMYEKEHRAILPLAEADKIVIPLELLEYFKSAFPEEEELDNFYDITADQKSIEFYMTKMEPNNRKIVGRYLSGLSRDPRVLFLFKVSKACLNSITLGCSGELAPLLESVDGYLNNGGYLRIYQATISDDYFALDFETVHQ